MRKSKPLSPKQVKRVNRLVKKECCNFDNGNCILLDDGNPVPVRSLFPVRSFAGGFQTRCSRLIVSFLQSFTHRRKNAAAPCAERPLRQNPTMQNIAPIAERKSQESRRRKGCEKREALLRNRGWKCSIYSCLLGAFQLMVGIHT